MLVLPAQGHIVHEESLPLAKVIGKWRVLPLLTFAKGPSTSIELWANSGPLKDCCSWIILPREGSLPKAPPVQYSHWVPAAVKARDFILWKPNYWMFKNLSCILNRISNLKKYYNIIIQQTVKLKWFWKYFAINFWPVLRCRLT